MVNETMTCGRKATHFRTETGFRFCDDCAGRCTDRRTMVRLPAGWTSPCEAAGHTDGQMTRERARSVIVDALADGWTGDGGNVAAHFYSDGLATDDDTTTWAEVFKAADLRAWSNGVANDADRSEAS